MTGLARKPAFWLAYALLALAALAVAWRLFPLAIPLVSLDIKLARHDAIAQAEARAAALQLVPAGARAAARFAQDSSLQSYVELAGGGKEVFAQLVAGSAYAPYWWEVRLFDPGSVTEATLRFRPDGAPHGFTRRVPESYTPADSARLALASDDARRIAEESARVDWGVDFAPYALLERTQQKAINGRLDHDFVYERSAERIGEARFRMRLTVTGDALTGIVYYAHVPESFERRFQELRSANNTIAGAASLAAGLCYGLGGCVLGVLWLLRRRWLLWRPALVAGCVVGGLMGAMSLANAPTAWFGFDTAQSAYTFWVRQIGGALLTAAGGAMAYGLVFMAAESLSRRAFAGHPQLWQVWSRGTAPTPQVLGRTVGGLLFVPIELAFVACFYYATNRWLGWWQPSEALTDPNILGSAIPALGPIALSLQAGLMEECLFRAVPLSLAALVGAHYGRRGLAIGIAVVAQALVFGAAHANYPGFPSYSRLVELSVPAMIWGLIFLRYGLLPAIVLHSTFDLVLFAIPVFLVDAPGSAVQRALVVAAGLTPLAAIAAQRLRAGAWRELPWSLRNGGWRPATDAADADADAPVAPVRRESVGGASAAFQRALPALALAGAIAWVACTPFRADVPPLPQGRADAVAAADAALRARGIELSGEWRSAALPKLAIEEDGQRTWHRFVWQEAGRDAYLRLVGSVLAPPLWEVRYARFDGPVAERAEEWRVTINADGTPRGVHHVLPEDRAGATLGRDAALALAQSEIRTRFGKDAAAMTLVGADEQRRPARTDWSFLFADPQVDAGPGAEARTLVVVAGDAVASAGRAVHVPETWVRAQREREGRLTIFKLLLAASLAVLLVAALVFGVVRWTRGQCDRRALHIVGVAALALAAAGVVERWPAVAFGLATAEPVVPQVAIAMLGALLGGVLAALLSGLTAGVGAWAAQRQPARTLAGPLPAWAAGAAGLLLSAGAGALYQRLVPQRMPLWPSHGAEAAWVPALAAALDGAEVLPIASAAVFALVCLGAVTAGFTRRRWLAVALLVLMFVGGGLAAGVDPFTAFAAGAAEGAVTSVVVMGLLRFDFRTVPAYIAAGTVLRALQHAAQQPTAAAWAHAAILSAVAIAMAWAAIRYLERARPADATR